MYNLIQPVILTRSKALQLLVGLANWGIITLWCNPAYIYSNTRQFPRFNSNMARPRAVHIKSDKQTEIISVDEIPFDTAASYNKIHNCTFNRHGLD